MPNVTPSEVRSIGDFATEDDIISERIKDANLIIESSFPLRGDEDRKVLLEKWLAAHLVAIREQPLSRFSVGESEYSFEGQTGLQLKFTRYGQQVLFLDTDNRLTAKRKHVNTQHSGRNDDVLDMDKYHFPNKGRYQS